jgi:allantoinase
LSSYDLIIKNSNIIRDGDLAAADICIVEGKIAAIQRIGSGLTSASHEIDAKEMLVLPGLIDPHVHFRDPGLTNKEDFLSGSKGASAGGVTTVFDMPTTQPVVTNATLLEEKVKILKAKSLVNFGLFGAASSDNLDEIESLARAGAIGFKTYMVAPPKERTKEYAGSFVTSSGQLYQVMQKVKKTGLVHCIHAESDSTIACLTDLLHSEGRKDPMAHYDSRPNFTEAEAVSDAIILSEALGATIHFVHVSTKEASELISNARERGADVSAETCPHYLCFSKEILLERGPYAKYNPPPRNMEDIQSLFQALNGGNISIISTDHAPHAKEEKQRGFEDIFKAPPGTPGVETRLPIILKMVYDGRLKLADMPKLVSESAARRFGLYPRKGTISIGADADLVIVDHKQDWKIKASELQTKAWETVLFDGMSVRGKVKYTILNGETSFEEGAGFSKPGSGQFIKGNVERIERV